ncbi:hypothetical protein KQH61_00360 [bacterium]|nr:hypothetical protein [bacterium]
MRIVLGKTLLRNENITVILFIPIFGILSAFWIEHLIKINRHGDKEIETLPLVLEDDILWSSIRSEYESNDLIPLEEALMINDHKIRRDMMLNALYDDPEKYLDILRIATHNDDVETAHYATTTISHLQRNYQLELQKASVAHEEDPENLENLNKYLELTEKYINSGLLEEYLLKNQRIAFSKALDRKMALVGDDKETLIKQLRNKIELKDYMAAFELSNRLISLWPEDEEVWIEALRVSVEGKDGYKLKETLDEMNGANIDWTKAGKERVEVWQG